MTTPRVEMDPEEAKRIRDEFLGMGIDPNATFTDEQPLPKRRGRPKGSTNKPKPSEFAPYRSDSDDDPLPVLNKPPLTNRDQKEVARRFAGILEGITGVAGVANPIFQMTKEEADNIATPLSTYLLRQEQVGSTFAKQVLEEYDLAAFTIALAAYVVRVYLDFKKERDEVKSEPKAVGGNRVDGKRSDTTNGSGQPITKSVGEVMDSPNLQTQAGTERPVSRQLATASEGKRLPSDV